MCFLDLRATIDNYGVSSSSSTGRGYEYELINCQLANKYECSICKYLAKEPQQTKCCGQISCKSCIDYLKERGSNFICPTCRTNLSGNYFYDRRIDREIKSLEVYCPNKETDDGCSWTGPLYAVEEHLEMCYNNDEFMKEQLEVALKEILLLRKKIDILEDTARNTLHSYIHMNEFTKLKNTDTRWYSPGFYIAPQSYKICLMIDANGFGDGKGTHLSVFANIMPGYYDDRLSWPFNGNVYVSLLDQFESRNHENKTINLIDSTPVKYRERVVGRERGLGWGYPKFMPHTLLIDSASKYIKDDVLCFKVNAKLVAS